MFFTELQKNQCNLSNKITKSSNQFTSYEENNRSARYVKLDLHVAVGSIAYFVNQFGRGDKQISLEVLVQRLQNLPAIIIGTTQNFEAHNNNYTDSAAIPYAAICNFLKSARLAKTWAQNKHRMEFACNATYHVFVQFW